MPIEIADTVASIREIVAQARSSGASSIALVPTMGGLHEGHISLVERAKAICDHVIVSIFVNPTQFNNPDDFATYPGNNDQDLAALEKTGINTVFMPSVEEMYPDGFSTTVEVEAAQDILCGAHRPGHFSGVATIVTKLFLQTGADVACFGEKDFQQLAIVRQLARDLDIPIRIEPVETVREPDGLAMSSRNRRLTEAERAIAPALHEAMQEARSQILKNIDVNSVFDMLRKKLEQTTPMSIEYFEMRSAKTLELLNSHEVGARIFAAANLGDVRLIDNIEA